jgi:transcriptional regulator with XRE-family HTH domain
VSPLHAHKRIGQNIRKYRKRAGLTQEKLAEKADLHPVYISQVERADRAITIDALLRITKALKIKLRNVVDDL